MVMLMGPDGSWLNTSSLRGEPDPTCQVVLQRHGGQGFSGHANAKQRASVNSMNQKQ